MSCLAQSSRIGVNDDERCEILFRQPGTAFQCACECVSVCVVPVVRESAQVSLWAFLVLTRLRMCPDLRAPWNTCDMRFGL